MSPRGSGASAKTYAFNPTCVATTTHEHWQGKDQVADVANLEKLSDEKENNYFKSAQWSADGTCVITDSVDNCIRTFVVPPDLLDERDSLHVLSPHSTLPSAEPMNAVTSYPLFNLQDPSTTLLLSSVRDHPIRLNSALISDLVGSYPLINPTTEAFISPHSLLFSRDGAKFIAGSDTQLSVFDLSRPGQGPVSRFQTGSRRNRGLALSGMSMKGIVSALTVDQGSQVLAAGTYTRHVGLYDSAGQGECVGIFCVAGTEADGCIGGQGVTQVIWSPCGRYLYIVERKSDGAMIYDIRQTGQLLGWLEGRMAMTNQRLGVDVTPTANNGGHEVWAGGTDSVIRVWENPHMVEGGQKAVFQWRGHDASISSAVVHPAGIVVASSSGQRTFVDFEDASRDGYEPDMVSARGYDNTLKLWAL